MAVPQCVDKPRFVIARSRRTFLRGALAHGMEQSDAAIRSLVPLVILKKQGWELRIATTGDIGHRFRNDHFRWSGTLSTA